MAAAPDPPRPADPPDFGGWVAARAPALLRFGYVLTGRMDEADAVVQQALSAAHARWRRLATSDGLEPRLQAMVVRAYLRLDSARRRDTRRVVPGAGGDQPWVPVPDTGTDPDLDSMLVWERCRGLTRRRRAALVLHCYGGLNTAESAAAMGGRERTARSAFDEALAAVLPTQGERREDRVAAVRQALLEHAELAARPYSPAARAVAGSRRRRRRRIATGATVAAALVVPVAWALVAGGGPTVAPPGQPGPAADPAAVDVSGWRWESWGGVQVQVPGSWGHGDLTQWCVPRGPDGPAVDRPGLGAGAKALCSLTDDGRPTYTGGLLLRRTEDGLRLSRADVAPYATTRIHTVGDVTLTVIDIDPAVGSAILTSAQVIGRRDPNGCQPHQQVGGAGFLAEGPTAALRPGAGPADSVSVCRYGLAGWPGPTLISSRGLTGGTADDLGTALRAAPEMRMPSGARRCRAAEREFAVLELWPAGDGGAAAAAPASLLVRYDGCRGHGLYDGRAVRRLTPGVMKPILVPPWSGGLSADVRRAVRRR